MSRAVTSAFSSLAGTYANACNSASDAAAAAVGVICKIVSQQQVVRYSLEETNVYPCLRFAQLNYPPSQILCGYKRANPNSEIHLSCDAVFYEHPDLSTPDASCHIWLCVHDSKVVDDSFYDINRLFNKNVL